MFHPLFVTVARSGCAAAGISRGSAAGISRGSVAGISRGSAAGHIGRRGVLLGCATVLLGCATVTQEEPRSRRDASAAQQAAAGSGGRGSGAPLADMTALPSQPAPPLGQP